MLILLQALLRVVAIANQLSLLLCQLGLLRIGLGQRIGSEGQHAADLVEAMPPMVLPRPELPNRPPMAPPSG
ncbi:hypothetical protein LP419_34030 [Massilia sp. H-1]|nr:hypothetical protein LP419_34030 [Massilia sp. H-1]